MEMRFAALGQGFGIENRSVGEIVDTENTGFDAPPTTVGEVIISSIYEDCFDEIEFSVAFATRSGVDPIVDAIQESSIKSAQCFIGADQEATSKQALQALLNSNVDTYWIRMRGAARCYHPKVYLFRGEEKNRLILGSANMTKPALTSNVEAAFIYEEPADTDGTSPISDIESSLVSPLQEHSEPLSETVIRELDERGIIGDETSRNFTTETTDTGSENTDKSSPLGVNPSVSPPKLSSTKRPASSNSKTSQKDGGVSVPSRSDLPPVPEVDLNQISTKTDRRFYERLCRGTDNQPSLMRRIIYSEGEITQGELKRRLVEDHDYDNSGSLDASLRVLWRTTDEVKKKGSGNSALLIWTGQ